MTKIYADGSRHVEQTVTEAGERIGASGRETYEKIITYVDGVQDKVEESAQQIDTSVTATQKRIDEALSGAKSELGSGIFGIIKDGISAVKNKDWAGIAETVAKLIWGQVTQSQRETVSAWAKKALAAINEAYAGGGLQQAFEAVSGILGSGIKTVPEPQSRALVRLPAGCPAPRHGQAGRAPPCPALAPSARP